MRRYITAAAAVMTLVGTTAVTTQAAEAQVVRGRHSYNHYNNYNHYNYDRRGYYGGSYYNRGYYRPYYRPGVSVSLGFGYPAYGYGYGYGYPAYGYGYGYPVGYSSYGYYGPSYYGCRMRTVWRVTPRGRVAVRQRIC